MYELTLRTREEFRYVLFEIDSGPRDPFHTAPRSPLRDVVDEVHLVRATAGGNSRISRWSVSVPAVLGAERKISHSIDALQPDAVVCHHQRFLHAPGVLRTCSAPTVYFIQEPRRRSFEYALRHGPEPRGLADRALSLPAAALESWASRYDIRTTRRATTILCNSDHTREYIWRAYGRDATVVPLGVDSDQFVMPVDHQRDNEVLAVGSLDATKGHDLAIEAVAHVSAAIRPRLRIVHNREAPGHAESLRALAVDRGVDLVLESAISDDLLVRRYQKAHAVLLTGRVEPLGLTSLEAMACGTPAVAVREGGYRETVINGVTGFLTDRRADALGEAISRVVLGELGATRETLRKHSITNFDWDRAADIYANSVRSTFMSTRDGIRAEDH